MHSFTAMMYSVMCKDKTHKKRHDILIHIFLTCCSRFCKVYYNGSVKEFWSNKQNFPSLLNLPDQIEKFEHLGLSWDATFEACLGGIKDLLKSARKNPESLFPRMVLLQKKQHIDILREPGRLPLNQLHTNNLIEDGVSATVPIDQLTIAY